MNSDEETSIICELLNVSTQFEESVSIKHYFSTTTANFLIQQFRQT